MRSSSVRRTAGPQVVAVVAIGIVGPARQER
jgi:hypothetical protein